MTDPKYLHFRASAERLKLLREIATHLDLNLDERGSFPAIMDFVLLLVASMIRHGTLPPERG